MYYIGRGSAFLQLVNLPLYFCLFKVKMILFASHSIKQFSSFIKHSVLYIDEDKMS